MRAVAVILLLSVATFMVAGQKYGTILPLPTTSTPASTPASTPDSTPAASTPASTPDSTPAASTPASIPPTPPPFVNPLNGAKLTNTFQIYNTSDIWSRIVANNETVYVLHPVQKQATEFVYNPVTIGRVLGYLYEQAEFGPNGPPGGFTISLFNYPIPSRRKRDDSVGGVKTRRATLVFKLKKTPVEQPTESEMEYWNNMLEKKTN